MNKKKGQGAMFPITTTKYQHGSSTSYLQQTPITKPFNSYCNIEKLGNLWNPWNLKNKSPAKGIIEIF